MRAIARLESPCAADGWVYEAIQDRASGLNDRKEGLRSLIRHSCPGEIGRSGTDEA